MKIMGFTNGKYGENKYLIYQFGENDVIETMSFGQITNNTIDGLAPATFTQMDTVKSIMYNITSKICLEDFLQKPVKKKSLLMILSGIIQSIRSAQAYMIDPSVILLDKAYVFLKLATFEMNLVCLPVLNPECKSTDLQVFLWELVAKSIKDKSENREYVSELMEKLDPDTPLSLDDIERIIDQFNQREAQSAIVKPEPQAYVPQNQDNTFQSNPDNDPSGKSSKPALGLWNRLVHQLEKLEKPKKKELFINQPIEDEQTNVILSDESADDSTVVERDPSYNPLLSKNERSEGHVTPSIVSVKKHRGTLTMHDDGMATVFDNQSSGNLADFKKNAHLIRLNNNEVIPIKGTIFQLGSDYEYSDYHIKYNRTVGGTHARIITHHNAYFIKDINSKNHTYVDDQVIPSMEEIKLHHGSRIRLGTERFVFKLYDEQ